MFAPLAAVVMLFAAWSAYWLFASAAVRGYSTGERQRLAAAGIVLHCDEEAWGGYPFRFEFFCARPHVTLPQGSLSSQRLQLVAQAYNPRHIIGLIDGPTEAQGFSRSAAFGHGRAIVSLNFRELESPRLSAEIPGLHAQGFFGAGKTFVHMRRNAGGLEMAMSIEALEVTIPGESPLLLDEAAVQAAGPHDRSLDIGMISLRQGKVKLWGKGGIGLDRRNRLSGKLATETNDIDGLLTAAEPFVRLDDKDRAAMKTVFGLLGKDVKAGLTARDGELFWGPFKLGDLGPLF